MRTSNRSVTTLRTTSGRRRFSRNDFVAKSNNVHRLPCSGEPRIIPTLKPASFRIRTARPRPMSQLVWTGIVAERFRPQLTHKGLADFSVGELMMPLLFGDGGDMTRREMLELMRKSAITGGLSALPAASAAAEPQRKDVAMAPPPSQLPGTDPLTREGDLAAQMVEGIHRYL